MCEFLIAFVAGLILWLIQLILWPKIKCTRVRINTPTYENPYPKDGARSFPYKVRFLRVRINTRFGKLEDCHCELSIISKDGEPFDTPGILHWARQPRSGVAHPMKLHEQIQSPLEAIDHMYSFHFSQNTPVDIPHSNFDIVDLLMKIEGLDYALTTVSRENRIPPGIYDLVLTFFSTSIPEPIRKTWCIEITVDAIKLAINYQ